MKKYLINPIRLFAGTLAFAFLIFIIIFNIRLYRAKAALTDTAYMHFGQRLSMSRMYYMPPYFIIMEDISFIRTTPPPGERIFLVPIARAEFSLKEFVRTGRISVTGISFFEAKADYITLSDFMKENLLQVIEFLKSLTGGDIEVTVKKAVMGLASENGARPHMNIDLSLKMRGESILSSGIFSIDADGITGERGKRIKKIVRGSPLRYEFKGGLNRDILSIESFEFIKNDMYSKLWGQYRGETLRLNGFSFINVFPKEDGFRSSPFNLFKRFISYLRRNIVPVTDIGMVREDVNILDIDCQIGFKFPRVRVDRLDFSLNNTPYRLSGDILFTKPIALGLIFSSQGPGKMDLRVRGELDRGVFNGRLEFGLLNKKSGESDPQNTEVDLEELAFYLDEYPYLKARLKRGDISCQSQSNVYKVSLDDLSALFDFRNSRFKSVRFRSLFYGGFLEGQGIVDITETPLRSGFNINIRGVDANKLDTVSRHFRKVHGRMDSRMHFGSYPKAALSGEIFFSNGHLDDFDFFDWLAGFFAIRSLTRVYFDSISAKFSLTRELSGLYDIVLDSQGLDLNGDFSLIENNLVASKLSLGLSRELLKDSRKFRLLLRLLGKDFHSIVFDFRLSGMLDKMNFQWLESDFKERLRASIPGFIERAIERQVEAAIQEISRP
ncbi:hypothetical protein ACFLZ3_02760 [Candidatus Omnitrophota bacterium]